MRVVGVLLAAAVMAPSAAAQARRKAKAWEDFLPPRLGDAELVPEGMLSIGILDGKYRLPGGKDGEPRQMTVTIAFDPDMIDHLGSLVVSKPGETRKLDDGVYEGMRLDGRFLQRRCDPAATDCQVDMALADRVWLRVRVERPTDRGEPLRWLKRLDLKGIETLARKEKLEPLSTRERHGTLAVLGRSDELANLPQLSVAEVVASQKPPPPKIDSLTPEQIKSSLDARGDIRVCHLEASAKDAGPPGGEIAVSFTVQPSGKALTDVKVETTTITDPGIRDCLLRQLRSGTFPPARQPTKGRHTFVFPPPPR